MDILKAIENAVKKNKVIVFMKGTPEFPQCGFSAQVNDILQHYKIEYAYINILENPDVRQNLAKFSNWPTFPQLFVNGELVGGCDIVTDLHQTGKLDEVFKDL